MSATTLSSVNLKTNLSFSLKANNVRLGAQRLLLIGGAIVFFLLTFALFYDNLMLRGLPLISSTIVSFFALIFGAIFFTHSKKEVITHLRVANDTIQLEQGNHIIHEAPLHKLSVEQVKWGMDADHCLPAIKIKGSNFPEIIIGSNEHCSQWTGVQPKVAFTDYLIISKKEWNTLFEVLK